MGFPGITNNSALVALRTLAQTGRNLADAQMRISSGYKINSARDDASIFTVAEGVRADISGIDAILENISTGQAAANTTLDALTQISNVLNEELKDLVVQAGSDGVDRDAIQKNVNDLLSKIDSIAFAANWNGVNLLSGTPDDLVLTTSFNRTNSGLSVVKTTIPGMDSTTAGLGIDDLDVTLPPYDGVEFSLNFGAGTAYADEDYFTIEAGGTRHHFIINQDSSLLSSMPPTLPGDQVHVITADMLGGETTNQTNGNLIAAIRNAGFSVQVNPDSTFIVSSGSGNVTVTAGLAAPVVTTAPAPGTGSSLQLLENAINLVNQRLTRLGGIAGEMESQGTFLKALHNTLTEGIGILVDADLAEESARLEALKTKQQLGIQALSIANQSQGAVLALLQ